MDCSPSFQFTLESDKLNILDRKLDDAINDIREILFTNAQTPCKGGLKEINIASDVGVLRRSLPPTLRIIELSNKDWVINFPPKWHHARGVQDSLVGKIFLQKNNWCRETLLHEALHSLSVFNDLDLRRRYSVFEDGLTEFFVGLILFKKYPDCYSNWLLESFAKCSMTHQRTVRQFYAFSNYISCRTLMKLYFWVPNRAWTTARSDFITEIQSSGYNKFSDILDQNYTEPTELFFEECEANFGYKFKLVSRSKVDYVNVKS